MAVNGMSYRQGGTLLSIESYDGTELQGYLESAGRDRLLIHFHGLAGNFYQNSFVHTFIKRAPFYKTSFLSANSRGHDGLSEANSAVGAPTLLRGAAYSKMHEIRSDLAAWIDFARRVGFRSVVIQGHSAGAVAIGSLFLNLQVSAEIVGAVFVSPTDMVGLQLATHGEMMFDELLALARRRAQADDVHDLMPAPALPGYRFDALTYLDLFEPGGPCDIFDFRSPERLRRLRRIGRPAFVLFGGGEDICSIPVREALAHIKTELAPEVPVSCRVIPDAPHSYRGHEEDVAISVLEWLSAL